MFKQSLWWFQLFIDGYIDREVLIMKRDIFKETSE